MKWKQEKQKYLIDMKNEGERCVEIAIERDKFMH